MDVGILIHLPMILAASSKSGESHPIDKPFRSVIGPPDGAIQYRITINSNFDMTVRLVSQIALYAHFNGVPFSFLDTSGFRIGSSTYQIIAAIVGHVIII